MKPSVILLGFICFFDFIPILSAQTAEHGKTVRVVENKNPINGNKQQIRLKHIRRFGGIENESDEAIIYRHNQAVLGEDGNIYILDLDEPHIKIFNSSGRLLNAFGERGQGPGEFSRPFGMDVDQAGNLYVGEYQLDRITVLTREGQFIRNIHVAVRMPFSEFKILRSGNVAMGTSGGFYYIPQNQKYTEPIIKIYDSEGKFIQGIGRPRPYDDQTMAHKANSVAFCLDEQENFYVTYYFQNRIEKYSREGQLLMSIRRQLNFPVTENPKARREMRNGVVVGAGYSPMNRVSCGIGVDMYNRIWVLAFSRQPERINGQIADDAEDFLRLEVYNQDGILLQHIPVEQGPAARTNAICLKKDKLLLRDYENASIDLYQIIN